MISKRVKTAATTTVDAKFAHGRALANVLRAMTSVSAMYTLEFNGTAGGLRVQADDPHHAIVCLLVVQPEAFVHWHCSEVLHYTVEKEGMRAALMDIGNTRSLAFVHRRRREHTPLELRVQNVTDGQLGTHDAIELFECESQVRQMQLPTDDLYGVELRLAPRVLRDATKRLMSKRSGQSHMEISIDWQAPSVTLSSVGSDRTRITRTIPATLAVDVDGTGLPPQQVDDDDGDDDDDQLVNEAAQSAAVPLRGGGGDGYNIEPIIEAAEAYATRGGGGGGGGGACTIVRRRAAATVPRTSYYRLANVLRVTDMCYASSFAAASTAVVDCSNVRADDKSVSLWLGTLDTGETLPLRVQWHVAGQRGTRAIAMIVPEDGET